MCVIIFIPEGKSIDEKELRNAWNTNPHGAGYSIRKNGKVYFKRGFMSKEEFINEIKPLIGKYDLVLHFRISTSKQINRMQTHPYKKGSVALTEGETNRPVICMNGIISGQKEYENCNDTMSYIVDHEEAFSVINQDILNIIESDTGAKWCVMTPNEVLISSKFVEYEGRFYSNKNHLIKSYYVKSYPTRKKYNTFSKMIKSSTLRKSIKKDKELYNDILDFIDIWCNDNTNDMCMFCTKCLKHCKTLREVKISIDENYYGEMTYSKPEDYDNICSLSDNSCFDYENFWDYYDYNKCYNIFDE